MRTGRGKLQICWMVEMKLKNYLDKLKTGKTQSNLLGTNGVLYLQRKWQRNGWISTGSAEMSDLIVH